MFTFFLKLTFLLCKFTSLTDTVSCQVAEDCIRMATFPCQCYFLIYPVGGSLGQPGRNGLPPLQLLLVVSRHTDIWI